MVRFRFSCTLPTHTPDEEEKEQRSILTTIKRDSSLLCKDVSLRMQSLSPHTMIQLKNTKEQKEGESKEEGVDLCVARETESISGLQQSLISHG
jgi:hypothetical protein